MVIKLASHNYSLDVFALTRGHGNIQSVVLVPINNRWIGYGLILFYPASYRDRYPGKYINKNGGLELFADTIALTFPGVIWYAHEISLATNLRRPELQREIIINQMTTSTPSRPKH